MNKKLEKKDQIKENEENNVIINTKSILIYALSFSIALGMNELIKNIFSVFTFTNKQIILQTTYVMILFTITLLIGKYLGAVKT
jgi:hypothetical protein